MLILVLRVVFVTLATIVGLTSGTTVYRSFLDDALPSWFGGAMGFGVAITLIACESAFRKHFTRSLIAFLIGLGAGLALTALLLVVLRLVIQDENTINNLDLPLALITTYLVLVIVLRNTDNFRVVVPFVEFRSERVDAGATVVDSAILSDGRLIALFQSGLLPRRCIIHRSVLLSLENGLTSTDAATVSKNRRALDAINDLRKITGMQVDIDDSEIPQATTTHDILIRLARLENAKILVADRDLMVRARSENVTVVDIGSLVAALSPTLRVGENISVVIEKVGDGRDQGIGYCDDGSMVVVTGAAQKIGEKISATIIRLHHTSNGRMIFATCAPTNDNAERKNA
jgi:uncharacterized protein YacL